MGKFQQAVQRAHGRRAPEEPGRAERRRDDRMRVLRRRRLAGLPYLRLLQRRSCCRTTPSGSSQMSGARSNRAAGLPAGSDVTPAPWTFTRRVLPARDAPSSFLRAGLAHRQHTETHLEGGSRWGR